MSIQYSVLTCLRLLSQARGRRPICTSQAAFSHGPVTLMIHNQAVYSTLHTRIIIHVESDIYVRYYSLVHSASSSNLQRGPCESHRGPELCLKNNSKSSLSLCVTGGV